MIYGRLRLFGPFTLTPGPAPRAAPVTLAAAEPLLAYLALHPGRLLDRDRLAFTLWPDLNEAGCLRTLRQALHRLRRTLADCGIPGEVITAPGRQLRFDPDAGLWVDVLTFQQAVEGRERPFETVELYRGDLLAGWAAEWVTPLRDRLRESYLRLLREQIRAAMMHRNYPRALLYAERLIETGPPRESSHRIYMEALYFNDRRAEALHHYVRLVTQLAEEFGAVPMPETRDLAERIKQGAIARHLPPLDRSRSLGEIAELGRGFIGRREQLDQMDESLARAMVGHGHFLLITGEEGIGKTRLLETWLRARAGSIALYHGPDLLSALHSAKLPWGAFPPQFPHLDAIRRSVETRLPQVKPEQLGTFLLTLSARTDAVTVIAVDDLHRADSLTWQVLVFLATRADRLSLLIVGAAQTLTAEQQRLRHMLERRGQISVMPLPPLSPTELTQFAELHGQGWGTRFYRLTEGSPFIAQAYCRAGHLTAVPPAVQAWAAARLDCLGVSGRCVVAEAARRGRYMEYVDLLALGEAHLLDGLEQALEAGVLREFGEGYTFTHYQIWQAAKGLPQGG